MYMADLVWVVGPTAGSFLYTPPWSCLHGAGITFRTEKSFWRTGKGLVTHREMREGLFILTSIVSKSSRAAVVWKGDGNTSRLLRLGGK